MIPYEGVRLKEFTASQQELVLSIAGAFLEVLVRKGKGCWTSRTMLSHLTGLTTSCNHGARWVRTAMMRNTTRIRRARSRTNHFQGAAYGKGSLTVHTTDALLQYEYTGKSI